MSEASAAAVGPVWLRAHGLDKVYRSRHRRVEVLRGASLEVRAGESVAITGASGSGKSTLLNLLGSLDRADEGSIAWGDTRDTDLTNRPAVARRQAVIATAVGLVALVAAQAIAFYAVGRALFEPMASAVVAIVALGAGVGTRILMPSPAEARRSHLRNQEIGFVFQQHHLLGDFTALENVVMPARVLGLPEREAHERARNLLVRVGLEARLDHLPGELSGGEQQRVAVARSMINRPRLLLLDEPGGNLDRQRADDLHELLLRLAREDGIAVVAVTHDESLARRADRWLRLLGGRLVDASEAPVPTEAAGGPERPSGEEDV